MVGCVVAGGAVAGLHSARGASHRTELLGFSRSPNCPCARRSGSRGPRSARDAAAIVFGWRSGSDPRSRRRADPHV